MDEKPILGKRDLLLLSQEKEKLHKMHLIWCNDMVNFEFGIATLRAKVRTTVEIETPPYPMIEKSEEESHNLHLAWYDVKVQLEFRIATLEANIRTQKCIEVDIEDILSLCNQSKPIKIQEAGINDMILELQDKAKKIINDNFSSCGIESFTKLRANNHENQCLSGLRTLSLALLLKDPKRKNDEKLGKKFNLQSGDIK
ncbi:hypothetical protein KY290_007716 [Solanum tuberosum]|uniref:Uncharacterized protein n=1 Tax=Solanum tuberosum TaxID=4113 RepID=A0ABQ7W6D6_SOLTU|nr:hypothetical protein KY290_007716 [Solanum tuberosum]